MYMHVPQMLHQITYLEVSDDVSVQVWEYIMTQHNLKKGQKLYGKQGKKAIKKQLQQLHNIKAFEPVDVNTLT